MDVFGIFGNIPNDFTSYGNADETEQPVVTGIVGENTEVVTPTIVTVLSGGNFVVHGVEIQNSSVAGNGSVDIVVASSLGGQVRTGTVRTKAGETIPTTISNRVVENTASSVNDNILEAGGLDGLVVEGDKLVVSILSSIQVVEGSGDIGTGVRTVVLDVAIPNGVDRKALRNQTIVTFNIFLNATDGHTVSIFGDD